MGFKSYDVELGGIPLMLATDKQGKQSIDFGKTAREPGPRAEIGSIVMPSFHHGPGQLLANDPRAVRLATNVDISVPSRVYPAGATTVLFTAGADDDHYWNQGGGSIIVPKQGNPTNAPKIYFVTAKRIYSVDTSDDSVATVYTNPSTLAFTGQVARYRDKLFFGREDEDREAATPIVLYLPSETAYEGTGTDMSYVFTAANSVWWVANHGYLTPPDIYWTDDERFPGDPVCVTVKYTGNGTAQDITAIPFQPDIAIVKGDLAEAPVLKTDTMAANESRTWDTATMLTTAITGFLAGGFSVGAHDAVNKDGVEYVAVCFKKKDGLIDTLTYEGDDADNRDVACSFSPDLTIVAKGSAGTGDGDVVVRPSTLTGDNTFLFDATTPIANAIQSLGASLFQVGTDKRTNENAIPYHAVIFKEAPDVLNLSTYDGDGTDDRAVELGLTPAYSIVKGIGAARGMQRMSCKGSDWSHSFTPQGIFINCIQKHTPTGIEVGSGAYVNFDARAYHCMAFGSTTSFNKAGPFGLDAGGYCTWLHAIGPYTLPFKADGMVYGVDEYGAPAPFLVHDEGGGTDFRFGHGARMDWRGRLLIPAKSSLKALNFPSLAGEDVNPLAQLPGSENDYYEIASICSMGSRQAIVLQTSLYFACFLSREYPDGEFLTPAFSMGFSPCYAIEAIQLDDGSYAAYFLHNAIATAGVARISKTYVAAIDHVAGPSTETTSGALDTSLYAGEGLAAGVTKAFLQLRGYAPEATEAHPITLKFSVDGGAKQSLGTITSPGPFSLAFPSTTAALGRFLAAHLDPLGDGNLALPLTADFEHCPAVDDIMTFGFDVRDVMITALGGISKRRAAHETQQALADMQGQIKTVKFAQGRPDWTVRVEDVTSQNITRRAFGQGEENLVFVVVRRLT